MIECSPPRVGRDELKRNVVCLVDGSVFVFCVDRGGGCVNNKIGSGPA